MAESEGDRVSRYAGPVPEIHFYRVHGLVLASEIELPELAPRRVPPQTEPDLHIKIGSVSKVAQPVGSTIGFVRVSEGTAYLEVPEVARYLVRDGREIIIDPYRVAEPDPIRTFLHSWAMAMVCLQRDLLMLHASGVAFGGRVVAFAGDQGAGKSTLAAHCVRQGAKLFADDMLRISFPADGRPQAIPGMPFVKLWRNALDGIGDTGDAAAPDHTRAGKSLVSFAGAIVDCELPLACVLVLEHDENAREATFDRLSGAAAVTALVTNSHGWIRSLDVAGRRPSHFKDCVRLANSIEVFRLTRRMDATQLPAIAACIVRELVKPARGWFAPVD